MIDWLLPLGIAVAILVGLFRAFMWGVALIGIWIIKRNGGRLKFPRHQSRNDELYWFGDD